jgi:hypothetical protein
LGSGPDGVVLDGVGLGLVVVRLGLGEGLVVVRLGLGEGLVVWVGEGDAVVGDGLGPPPGPFIVTSSA